MRIHLVFDAGSGAVVSAARTIGEVTAWDKTLEACARWATSRREISPDLFFINGGCPVTSTGPGTRKLQDPYQAILRGLREIRLGRPDSRIILLLPPEDAQAGEFTAGLAVLGISEVYCTAQFSVCDMRRWFSGTWAETGQPGSGPAPGPEHERGLEKLETGLELKVPPELRSAIITDALTGCYNRRYLDACLREHAIAFQQGGLPFSVLICDIDRFKQVNDTYGHRAGDEVLRQFGAFLRAGVKESDIVCRYGGEEFVILFPRTAKQVAWETGNRLRREWQLRRVHHTTFSGGVAEIGVEAADENGLLEAADGALYRAKEAGRNQVIKAGEPVPGPPGLVLPAGDNLRTRVLVVVGAERRVGATAFALGLAAFLAGKHTVEVIDGGGGASGWLQHDRHLVCRQAPPYSVAPGVVTVVDAGLAVADELLPLADTLLIVTDLGPGAARIKPLAGNTCVVGNRGAPIGALRELAALWEIPALCALPENPEVRAAELRGVAPLPKNWLKPLRSAIHQWGE